MDASIAVDVDTPRPSKPRRLIAGLGIAQILGWGSSFYLPAVFAAPIAADTGWSLTLVVAGFSVALFISGLAAPGVGQLISRHGGRRVLVGGFSVLALGLVALGLAPNLPLFFAAWVVIGLGMSASLYDAAFSALGRLYGPAARRAITTLTLFGGFASSVCWPLSAFLVEMLGWRGACLTYAAVHVCICVPLLLFVLPREAPEVLSTGEGEHGAAKALTLSSRSERRSLVILTAILMTGGLIFSLFSVHLLTLLQAGGLPLAAAVALSVMIGPSQVGGRVVEMAFGYRFHPIWTLVTATVLILAGMTLLASGLPMPALALILYGAGNGIWSIAKGTLPLALFGQARYPVIMGRLAMPALIVQAIAPSLGAVVLEHAGAYWTLGLLVGFAVANVMLVLLLVGVQERGLAR